MVSETITAEQVAEARRDLGKQLAAWRLAAGLTQVGLGPRIGYSRSAVANVEVGREHAPLGFWQSVDRQLSAGGVLFAAYRQFAELERRHKVQMARERDQIRLAKVVDLMGPMAAENVGPTSETAADSAQGLMVSEPQLRLVAEDLIPASRDPDGLDTVTLAIMSGGQTQPFRIRRRALLELAATVAAAPMASVEAPPASSTVDPALVEHFAALRALLVQADDKLGGTSILPTVQQQTVLIAQFRRQARGFLRERLLGAEARWSEFGSWLSDDLGDGVTGAQWLDRAASMAQEANDGAFYAYVLARRAQRVSGTGDEDRVIGLARAAARTPDAPVLVRAFATVQEAQGCAAAGDVHGFQSALDRARLLIRDDSVAEGGTDALGAFCTWPYLDAQEGEGWLRLNEPGNAVTCFTAAVEEWPESYRRERGMYLSRTAHAYLAAIEPDQAAVAASEALALAMATGSARIRNNLVALCGKLGPFRAEPSVRGLLEQMGMP
ncbi:hypothetical protein GCM10027280_63200 [Micromonospora polyrhachis]